MKNARPQTSEASALDQRRDSITDLFPETVPRRPAPIVPTKGTV